MTRNYLKYKAVRAGVLSLGVLGAVAAATLGGITPAQAQTITFEGDGNTDYVLFTTAVPYTEGGITFTTSADRSAIVGGANPGRLSGDDSHFLIFDQGTEISLASANGGTFDLTSLLLGPTSFPSSGTVNMTIVGQVFGGGTVSQTFENMTTSTNAVLNYKNLTSATISTTGVSGIDNIVATAGAAAPEPGSIALLLTAGVPVVGIVRRRKLHA